MKRRNFIPLIVMLMAGFISSLISITKQYNVPRSMIVIFVSMFLMYIIGLVARGIINSNVKQMEEREAERLRIEEEKRLEEEAMAALLAEEENGEETGTRAAEDMQIV